MPLLALIILARRVLAEGIGDIQRHFTTLLRMLTTITKAFSIS